MEEEEIIRSCSDKQRCPKCYSPKNVVPAPTNKGFQYRRLRQPLQVVEIFLCAHVTDGEHAQRSLVLPRVGIGNVDLHILRIAGPRLY